MKIFQSIQGWRCTLFLNIKPIHKTSLSLLLPRSHLEVLQHPSPQAPPEDLDWRPMWRNISMTFLVSYFSVEEEHRCICREFFSSHGCQMSTRKSTVGPLQWQLSICAGEIRWWQSQDFLSHHHSGGECGGPLLLPRQICRCGWQGPERERYYFCEKFIAEHSTWPRRKLVTSSWLGIPQQTTRRAIDINIVFVIMDECRLNFCYLFRNVQLVPKVKYQIWE